MSLPEMIIDNTASNTENIGLSPLVAPLPPQAPRRSEHARETLGNNSQTLLLAHSMETREPAPNMLVEQHERNGRTIYPICIPWAERPPPTGPRATAWRPQEANTGQRHTWTYHTQWREMMGVHGRHELPNFVIPMGGVPHSGPAYPTERGQEGNAYVSKQARPWLHNIPPASTQQSNVQQSNARPHVLLIALDPRFAQSHPIFHTSLLNTIRSIATVHTMKTPVDVLLYLGRTTPKAILLMDAVIMEYVAILQTVVQYAHQGGTVVCMPGHFNTDMLHEDFERFFANFGLSWAVKGCFKVRVFRDPRIFISGWPVQYVVEARFLKGMKANEVVYGINARDSDAIQALQIEKGDGSVAFAAFARVSTGALGYVGDAEESDISSAVILRMCDLSVD
jgi:hypothetical protein